MTESFSNSFTKKDYVLIVDDEQHIIEFTGEVFKRLGYEVFSTIYGKEGLDIFLKNTDIIKIVLLDIVIPDMSGMDLFETMHMANSKTKFIMTSGYTMSYNVSRIVNNVDVFFLEKPFRLKDLKKTILKMQDRTFLDKEQD